MRTEAAPEKTMRPPSCDPSLAVDIGRQGIPDGADTPGGAPRTSDPDVDPAGERVTE